MTGAVLASLRPGKEVAHDAWQFATPDLLNAFSDWQKAVIDIQYQETQLKAIRDLNESRMAAQKEVVARMEKLVAAGTDTQKDLVAERTNLIQFQIQGRKDIRDQEEAVAGSPADRGHAVAAASAGRPGADHAPLRRRRGRHRGRGSAGKAHGHREARHDVRGAFLRPAHASSHGKVSGISPVISKDKRVLNVQFIVKDPEGMIRPGMFAEVGLGTDKRQSLLMPADGVLHVEDKDYALVAAEPGIWRIVEVQVGELQGRGRRGPRRPEGRRPRAGQGGHPAQTGRRPLPARDGRDGQRRHGRASSAGRRRPMNLVIQTALRLRWVVLLLALGVVGWGVWAFKQQPIDAYPDISAQMVQIITFYPGRAPEDVERQVTIPIENAMLGVPRVETVRSRTIFGLSLVQMEFEEGTEGYWARQRVTEQLGDVNLPDGVQPQLGPYSTRPTEKSTAMSWFPTAGTT